MDLCACGQGVRSCCGRGPAHDERVFAIEQNQRGWIEIPAPIRQSPLMRLVRHHRGHTALARRTRIIYRPRLWVQEEDAKSCAIDYFRRRKVKQSMELVVAIAAMATVRAGVLHGMELYDQTFMRMKRSLQADLQVYELVGYKQPPHLHVNLDAGKSVLISLTDNSWAYFSSFGWTGRWGTGGYVAECRQEAVFGAYQTRATASCAIALGLLGPLTRDAASALWHHENPWNGSEPPHYPNTL